MPSCTALDRPNKPLVAARFVAGAPVAGHWYEQFCDEEAHGRQHCPPGRCRFGGTEHDQPPTPEEPWGASPLPGAIPPPGLAPEGARRRGETVARLAADVERLVATLNEAVPFGGLAPAEYAHLQHLQVWLGTLVAERDAKKGGARNNGNGGKKKRK